MTTAPASQPAPVLPPPETAPAGRRDLKHTLIGVVTSDRRQKTRTVAVTYQFKHPKYGKYIQRQSTYHVHDEKNDSKLGDRVEIANCRPLSKTKSWRLLRIVERSRGAVEHASEAPVPV